MRAGWTTRPLGDLCEVLDSRRKPVTKKDRTGGEYPYYGASGILDYVDGYLFDEPLVLLGEDGAKWGAGESSAFAIEGKCWVNNHAHVLRPNRDKLRDAWLIYVLNDADLLDFVSGLTVPKLNQANMREIPIPLPLLAEQDRIVAILDQSFDAIASPKANAERSLRMAREVFDAELLDVFATFVPPVAHQTLSEVCLTFGRGKSKHRPRNDPKLYGGPYPFIQTGDVRNAGQLITEHTQTYSAAGLAQSKLWPKGTLCITIAANIAETGILTFDACFPDSVIGAVVDPKQTTTKFVEYLLRTVKADLKAKGKGTAQDNINLATFENERYPFPDLPTQSATVERFDALLAEVQTLEDLYERKLTALDELRTSLLHQAFHGDL